jgi:hypothetical protein
MVCALHARQFYMNDTSRSGRPCCGSGGIWRGLSIVNCLRRTWPSLLNATVNNFAVWRKKSSKNTRPGWRHGVILRQENARPHTANMTKVAIQELDWEIFPHPPHSSDLAPSYYHLFRSLSNNLPGVSFNNGTELQNCSMNSSQTNRRISSSMGSTTYPNTERQSWIMEENK